MPCLAGARPIASSAGLPKPSVQPSTTSSPADPPGDPDWAATLGAQTRAGSLRTPRLREGHGWRQGSQPRADSRLLPASAWRGGLGRPGLGRRRLPACEARARAGRGVGGAGVALRRNVRGSPARVEASTAWQHVLTPIHAATSRLRRERPGRTRARRHRSPGPGEGHAMSEPRATGGRGAPCPADRAPDAPGAPALPPCRT